MIVYEQLINFMKNFYAKFLNGTFGNALYLTVFVLLALWIYIPTLGIAELKSWDEAIYAAISRTIYETGDYLHLQYHGGPYFNKPPLYFYLTTLAYHIGGINEFTARIVAVVWGIGCVLLTYMLAVKLFGKKVAVLSIILLLSNYHFFKTVQQGRMESMVAFFIVLACYSFYMIVENRLWVYVFTGAIAVGVLTKGAMGLVPLLIVFPFAAMYPRRWKPLFHYHTVLAAFLFLLLVLPWYYFQFTYYGDAYVDQALTSQLFDRISKPIEGHKEPLWYYVHLMSLHYVSNWSLLVVPALIFIAWHAITKRTSALVFLALFCWIILLFFSCGIQTKLPWYIFTIYVPLSIVGALFLVSLKRFLWLKHFVVITSLISIALFPVVKSKAQPDNLKALQPDFERVLQKDDTVVALHFDYPALNYYANADLQIVNSVEDLARQINQGSEYIVVRNIDFVKIKPLYPVKVLAQNANYSFVRVIHEDR